MPFIFPVKLFCKIRDFFVCRWVPFHGVTTVVVKMSMFASWWDRPNGLSHYILLGKLIVGSFKNQAKFIFRIFIGDYTERIIILFFNGIKCTAAFNDKLSFIKTIGIIE